MDLKTPVTHAFVPSVPQSPLFALHGTLEPSGWALVIVQPLCFSGCHSALG